MDTTLYNQKGEKAGTIALPAEIFGLPWNADLVHQVTQGMESNKRAGTADTKGRGEVRGGGRKPWKQKGTGQARHGSTRSPIWKGGGITHGPLAEKNYNKKINQKMRTKALYTALSRKVKDSEVLFIDALTLPEIKTKTAATLLQKLSGIKGFEKLSRTGRPVAFLALPARDEKTMKSFRNIPSVFIDTIQNLNVVDVMSYRYLVMAAPEEGIKFLSSKMKAKK